LDALFEARYDRTYITQDGRLPPRACGKVVLWDFESNVKADGAAR
jgi:hypothetical protein